MPQQTAEHGGASRNGGKSKNAFRTISEVAGELDVPQHVLRFWESKFSQVRPMKRGGNRRYYRPEDVELLSAIRHFLYTDGYTIKGVQKLIKDNGVRKFIDIWDQERSDAAEAADAASTSESSTAEPAAAGNIHRSELEAVLKDLKALRRALAD